MRVVFDALRRALGSTPIQSVFYLFLIEGVWMRNEKKADRTEEYL